jgi:hypothetical protein
MNKIYLYTTLMFLFFSLSVCAQETKQQYRLQETAPIEGLNMYPNPVTNGKVYIATKNDLDKDVQIYDVLGKKVLQTILSSRELNVAVLPPGIYIIKIREEEASTTRKLIII